MLDAAIRYFWDRTCDGIPLSHAIALAACVGILAAALAYLGARK